MAGHGTYRDLDPEECERQLGKMVRDSVKSHVEQNGVRGLKAYLRDQVQSLMQCKVNIAIVGATGAGKSSLLNSIRNLKRGDRGFAEVGCIQTTLEPKAFESSEIANTLIWDLPGVYTKEFVKDTYIDKVNFDLYDALIIVCCGVFTPNDFMLATEAKRKQKPYYFVRSHVDVAVESCRRDGRSSKRALDAVRRDLERDLREEDLPADRVYLVSSIIANHEKWDFPKFRKDLVDRTPEKNRNTLILSMISCSKEVIAKKVGKLRKLAKPKILFENLSKKEDYLRVIDDQKHSYMEQLGISESDLSGRDNDNLLRKMEKIKKKLSKVVEWQTTEAERDGVTWFFRRLFWKSGDWAEGEKVKEKENTVKEACENLGKILDLCEKIALDELDFQGIKSYNPR